MLKKAIITSAKIVTFLLITFLILSGITEIFKYKSTETVSRTYYCYPGNTFDVIFLGSSVMKNDVYPMQLYSEQGIWGAVHSRWHRPIGLLNRLSVSTSRNLLFWTAFSVIWILLTFLTNISIM